MNEDLAIFIAILFFIAIVIVWIGSIIYKDPPYNDSNIQTTRQCLPGQCAVNLYSGVKRCPINHQERINANISYEVCSAAYICDNIAAPLSVDNRGVAITGNICPSNIQCQCLPGRYCGEDIVSYFAPYGSSQDPLVKYEQKTTVQDALGNTHTGPPYYLGNNGYCTISPKVYAQGALTSKTCLFGTLAYFPPDNRSIDGLVTPLACVRGNPCPSGQDLSAVWDPVSKNIKCEVIKDSVISR